MTRSIFSLAPILLSRGLDVYQNIAEGIIRWKLATCSPLVRSLIWLSIARFKRFYSHGLAVMLSILSPSMHILRHETSWISLRALTILSSVRMDFHRVWLIRKKRWNCRLPPWSLSTLPSQFQAPNTLLSESCTSLPKHWIHPSHMSETLGLLLEWTISVEGD